MVYMNFGVGGLMIVDPDAHPIPTSLLELHSDELLIPLVGDLITFVQEEADFANIWETIVLTNVMITVDRAVRVIMRRYGSLDILSLGQADLVFVQRAQRQLLTQQTPRLLLQQQQPDNIVQRQRRDFQDPFDGVRGIENERSGDSYKDKYEAAKKQNKEQEFKRLIEEEKRKTQEETNKRRREEQRKKQQEQEESHRRRLEEKQEKEREDQKYKDKFEKELKKIEYAGSYERQYKAMMKKREEEESLKRRLEEEQRPKRQLLEPTRLAIQESKYDSDSDSDDESKKFDPYEAMGLKDRDRTPENVIRVAYNSMALALHPDKQRGKSQEAQKHAAKRMCDINQARDILLNAERRKAYDEAGAVYPHEVEAWKKKNGGLTPSGSGSAGAKGKGKYIPP